MTNVKKIKQEIEFLKNFKQITEIYEEIAIIKMKKIRDSILSARKYETILTDIFSDVNANYRVEIERLSKKKKFFFSFNEKSIAILITPNVKFYGGLINKVFNLFLKNIENYNEAIIIGQTGKSLWFAQKRKPKIKIALFTRFTLTEDEIKKIINKISNFNKIDVYHPKFKNLINQFPTITNISGYKPQTLDNTKEAETFLVEPSLKEIITFFKTQILTSLFKSTLSESRLALLGARINTMEKAMNKTTETLNSTKSFYLKQVKKIKDKSQINQLAGINLW